MTPELTLLSRVAYRDQEIASPRLRSLLALLATDLHVGASSGRLIEGLWLDEQPTNPTKALQVLVSRARAQLGADVIASTPTGYRLALEEHQVDASAIVASANACARLTRSGDHAAVLERAESGLALWDGPASAVGTEGDSLAELRRERATSYAALNRARALSWSRLGRHDEAVPALTDLLAERPRDEELLLELLRSEAATAGPSAALMRYDAYRRCLRDELGSDPGPALVALHQQLLQGEAPTVRHGVPHEPNALLGRDDDIATVSRLVRTSRVTTIVGPGGLGKTRLANVISRQADQRVVHLIGLAGVTTDDGVVAEVASALGVRDPRLRAPSVQLRAPRDVLSGIVEALGPGPALLVLDNCEHVVAGAAELVQSLISLSPDLRVLTTSRSPLGLSSESVYLLPELDTQTSVDLFTQRARAARPDVELPADAVERLCQHLDGLPLAVELAAARTRVMSVPQIEQRLQDRFSLLQGGRRDAPERHRTLQAVIEWSWNLLDELEQQALAALSVFPDGFSLDAADALLGTDALRALEQLIDQSLLKIIDAPTGSRFRMLETVREFGLSRLDKSGEADAVRRAYLAWAHAFSEAQAPVLVGPDPYDAVDLVRLEQDNLVAALRLAVEEDDSRTVAATYAALGTLWTIESTHLRAVAVAPDVAWALSHTTIAPADVETARTALVMCAANSLMFAQHTAGRALALLRRLPKAPTSTYISAMGEMLAQVREISQPSSTVLRTMSESSDPTLACVASGLATQIWENEGLLDDALGAAKMLVEFVPDGASPWLIATAHTRLGELYQQTGRHEQSERELLRGLAVLERLGCWADVTQTRWALVLARLHAGDVAGAEQWLERAGESLIDHPLGMRVLDVGVRAEIELAKGNTDAGLRFWRQAADRVQTAMKGMFQTDPPGMEPWTMSTEAIALTAHAYEGQVDAVSDLSIQVRDKTLTLLGSPQNDKTFAFLDYPVAGLALLAIGLVQLSEQTPGDEPDEATANGIRLIALAEAFDAPRSHPTMDRARARELARGHSSAVYDEARSSYTAMDRDGVLAEGLRLLDQI